MFVMMAVRRQGMVIIENGAASERTLWICTDLYVPAVYFRLTVKYGNGASQHPLSVARYFNL